jgi:hypothetical protein
MEEFIDFLNKYIDSFIAILFCIEFMFCKDINYPHWIVTILFFILIRLNQIKNK